MQLTVNTFSEIPSFTTKSSWKPPRGYPNLKVFLSQIEHEIFKTCEKPLSFSNLSRDEWRAVRSLADDPNYIIKKADKGSYIIVWGKTT